MPTVTAPANLSPPRAKVLSRLKRLGPQDADAIARALGVTAMAVRQHLYALEAAGLVTSKNDARTRGRPAKLWQATERANSYFPDAHAALAVELIGTARAAFGEAGLDRLIAARTARQLADYTQRLKTARTLKTRLAALAKIRTEEGYLCDTRTDGADYLLVENHCPICDAARACLGLCRQELELFRAILGPGVSVEREDHILQGARRCAYRIRTAVQPKTTGTARA
jgi:predicted ArsR family transcriptional regulator